MNGENVETTVTKVLAAVWPVGIPAEEFGKALRLADHVRSELTAEAKASPSPAQNPQKVDADPVAAMLRAGPVTVGDISKKVGLHPKQARKRVVNLGAKVVGKRVRPGARGQAARLYRLGT